MEGLLENTLKAKQADETELIAIRSRQELTRFTGGQIHQNVASEDTHLFVRAWIDGKHGVAETNDLSPDGLQRAVRSAAEAARCQTAPAGYHPPDPQPLTEINAWDEATWEVSPDQRADLVAQAVREANAAGYNASGALSSGGSEVWVLSSRGVRAHARNSAARFITVIMGNNGGSGYAAFSSSRMADFEPEATAARALAKARASEARIAIEPGEYTVVLEEPAVATILGMMSFMGFSARALLEKRSYLEGVLGQKLVSELVTVYDDGLDTRGTPMPFDFEGVPKQRVYFFRRGVAEGVVHDTRTATAAGVRSTGHALPPSYSAYAPMPGHVIMQEGQSDDQGLIAGVERGLLVTRFHYARPVEPRKSMMTMMTRDGTFLIEDGRVTQAVEDMRVTESGLRALGNVDAVGSQQQLVSHGEGYGGYLVPQVRIEGFRFTGRTERR